MPKTTKYVKKAFTLLHDGKKHEFAVGQVLPEQFHEHWYAQAHSGEQPVAADAGAAGDELLAELAGKAKELDEREKAADQLKKDLQAGFHDLRTLKAEVEARVLAADQREADLNARAEALDGREVAIAEREKAAEAAAKQQAAGKK